ncbi:hypothetical protein M1K46_22635 [Fictibacillus sp. WQ 8-8]|nr:hypothetical protein [Fictibacillus sp. WQ 8-8]MCQ6268388.1 hypothetical protein [Fictibacillus sp. WQ 8-8]
MDLVDRVTIYEVGLRDGLQLESKLLTSNEKLSVIELLHQANVSEVEFGSFVHPKLVPQMANTGELYSQLKTFQGVQFVGLVPNLKGLEIAKENGVKAVNYVLSASNTHNEQNTPNDKSFIGKF